MTEFFKITVSCRYARNLAGLVRSLAMLDVIEAVGGEDP